MPEYHCECCNYTTNKKSNFDNHNKSTKHLDKLGGKFETSSNNSGKIENDVCSMISVASNESYMTIKVRELENIIKLKDMELKMKDEQIGMLQNTINILSQNKPIKEEPKEEIKEEEPKLFCQKVVKPKKIAENIKMEIQEIKQNDSLTLINIEDFYKTYIQNSQETKYTYKFETETTKFTALRPMYYKKEHCDFNMMKAVMTVITDAMKELPKNVSFYKCKDERRRIFEIKSNNEIISSKNVEEIDKFILKLFKDTYNFLLTSFVKMNSYFNSRWTYFSSEEENLLKGINQKKFMNEPITEREELLLKKEKQNTRVKNEFKKLTECSYENFKSSDGGWVEKLSLSFFNFDEKQYNAGFSHLRTFLATNKYDEKYINKEHERKIKQQEEEEEEENAPSYYSESE